MCGRNIDQASASLSLPISDRLMSLPACLLFPVLRPFRPRGETWRRPIRAPGFPPGVGWHPLVADRRSLADGLLDLLLVWRPVPPPSIFCFLLWYHVLLLHKRHNVILVWRWCPDWTQCQYGRGWGFSLFPCGKGGNVCNGSSRKGGLATVVACWDQGGSQNRCPSILPRTDDKAEMVRFNAAGKIRPRPRPSVASPSRSPIQRRLTLSCLSVNSLLLGASTSKVANPSPPQEPWCIDGWHEEIPQLETTPIPQAPAVKTRVWSTPQTTSG